MDFTATAAKFAEALKPRRAGEQVNVHVIKHRAEPKPDFDAMQRLISGEPRSEKDVAPPA